MPWMGFLIPHSHRECQRRVRRRGLSPARGVLRAVQSHRGCAAPSRQPCGRCRYTHGRSLSVQKIVNLFHNSSEHELTRRKHPSVKDWRAWSILALSAYRGTRKKSTTRRDKGLWRGVGEPLLSPCQKGINEFVGGSHVAELIQHKKVIDYTATIQWLPHSISTFFGLLRAFHAATLHHTAKRRLGHIQQPTVRL